MAARKTLGYVSHGVLDRSTLWRDEVGRARLHEPQRIHAHHLHKLLRRVVVEQLHAADSRVGEEDVQPAVPLNCIVDDGLDGRLVRGVKLPRVHVDAREQRGHLALVRREVLAVKVADVDGPRAVGGELVRRGSACS